MRVKIIATIRNSYLLVPTTHTCCNKKIHVAVEFMAKDQFSGSVQQPVYIIQFIDFWIVMTYVTCIYFVGLDGNATSSG
jgi:hypothetical protein